MYVNIPYIECLGMRSGNVWQKAKCKEWNLKVALVQRVF